MNSVNLIGRIGQALELRATQSGTAVVNFSLAVKGRRRQGEDTVDWVRVVAWGRTAELLCEHKGKGDEIAVSGRISVRDYESSAGEKRTSVEVVAESVTFVGPPRNADGYSGYGPRAPESGPAPSLDSSEDIPF